MILCRPMRAIEEAFDLLNAFLNEDEYLLDSAPAYGKNDSDALRRALTLFLEKPLLGFVWLAIEEGQAIGACVISYAISTSAGGLVAKLDDVTVDKNRLGEGVGTQMLAQLRAYLEAQGIRRIDTSCHLNNTDARRFYLRLGFQPLNEERLALPLAPRNVST